MSRATVLAPGKSAGRYGRRLASSRCADASVRIRLRVSDEQIVVFEQQSDAVEAIRCAAIEPYARTAPGNRTLVDRPGAAVFEAVEHTPTSTGKPRRLAAPRSRRIAGRFIPRHFFRRMRVPVLHCDIRDSTVPAASLI
ncbi:hypothetical protein [Burkholderia dolosa]|uniref:hypothetical protein n=1 Tax=Burkholderia dolosa TaxID=152500 RepID=UPI0027D32BFE|nr:hypothetical protein [Burkholderia dolosa]